MKKRVIAVCLAVLLVSSPLWAETQKQMLYRLQDELNDLKQRFEELIDEMTVKFTQIREMNRQGLDEMNRHLQTISKQLNDQDGRIKAIEPRVEALENAVSSVAVSDIGDPLPKGSVPPIIGDAVHLNSSDQLAYKADPFFRNNIIGVLGPNGRVYNDIVEGITGLSASSKVYLDYPDISSSVISYSSGSDTDYRVRYDPAEYSQSQGFTTGGVSNLVMVAFGLNIGISGTPSYNVYLELRSDDGTGKPSSTVLATSEALPSAEMVSSPGAAAVAIYFRFTTPYLLLAGTTYHISVQADTSTVDSSNYVIVRGLSTGLYANGQRCVSDNAGAWTAGTGTDLQFALNAYYVGAFPGATTNLTTTNPLLDVKTRYALGNSTYVIGNTLTNGSILRIAIYKKPIITFLNDYTTTISNTGTTAALVPFARISTYGNDIIRITYRLKTNNVVYTGSVTPYWNGVAGSAVTTQKLSLISGSGMATDYFINSVSGVGVLSFLLDSNDASGVTTVGMVTVVGN